MNMMMLIRVAPQPEAVTVVAAESPLSLRLSRWLRVIKYCSGS
jgi:hypothetical protein